MKTEFETFKFIGSYEKKILTKEEPYVYSGGAVVEKYRVTIERIPEPVEVYQQRLQKLWEECDNQRMIPTLKQKAGWLKYQLKGSFGSMAKNK